MKPIPLLAGLLGLATQVALADTVLGPKASHCKNDTIDATEVLLREGGCALPTTCSGSHTIRVPYS